MARDLEEVVELARKFREERDWAQFHSPKDLAISVAIEAGELLETFQWSGADTENVSRRDQTEQELADVFIYCLYLADALGVSAAVIIERKLKADAEKYPVERARGAARKYTEL